MHLCILVVPKQWWSPPHHPSPPSECAFMYDCVECLLLTQEYHKWIELSGTTPYFHGGVALKYGIFVDRIFGNFSTIAHHVCQWLAWSGCPSEIVLTQ